jgi:putative oxidoreductase
MRSVSVLLVRLVAGGFLAGHGAQKLFGWFGGDGLDRTAGQMTSLRLRPGSAWARLAGGSELGGGLLTALGLLNPLGPVAGIGAMAMAWAKVHLGKGVWGQKGGAELPLTNLAILAGLTLAGPGRLSLDSLLGIRIPRRIGVLALAGALGAVWAGARREIEAGTADLPAGTAEPIDGMRAAIGEAVDGVSRAIEDAAAPRPMRGVMAERHDAVDDAADALRDLDADPARDTSRPGAVPWSGLSGADVATAGSGTYAPRDEGGDR